MTRDSDRHSQSRDPLGARAEGCQSVDGTAGASPKLDRDQLLNESRTPTKGLIERAEGAPGMTDLMVPPESIPHNLGEGDPLVDPEAAFLRDQLAIERAIAAERRASPPPLQDERLADYLRTLAVTLALKHYPEVTNWKPLPDALGLLTQIDNMTTGLVRAPVSDKQEGEALRDRIYNVLRGHRLTNLSDEDGLEGYPLVDAVSNDAPATIATGEEQLAYLADELADALSSLPTVKRGGMR